MDFMFEDEVDEVGSDVEAYCPKCKADTTHVVISKYEDEIRRVQCNPCGDVHSYRKPRGEVEDEIPEPIAAKKRALLKKPTWEEFFAKHGEKQGKPYEFREAYSENAIVTHPKFGRGFVTEVMSDSKVEITFKDARRVLVHNRRDMPGLPLAAEGDGIPSKGAKAKAAKTKAAKEDKAAAAAAAPVPPAPPKAGAPAGKAAPPPAAGKAASAPAASPKTSGKSAPAAAAPAAPGKGAAKPAAPAPKSEPKAGKASPSTSGAPKGMAKPAKAAKPSEKAEKVPKASAKPTKAAAAPHKGKAAPTKAKKKR